MIIKRGIIQSFNAATYTATVLLFEATSTALIGVPVSNVVDGTSCLANALCAVLFFDEHNLQDAVVIATFANGSSGLPAPAPGRVTFVTSQKQINNVAIASGTTSTFQLAGGSSNIPAGALGVLYGAFFTSTVVSAFLYLAPHGAAINSYAGLGAITVANQTMFGSGMLGLSADGKIDIQALNGACSVTMFTYGYVQ